MMENLSTQIETLCFNTFGKPRNILNLLKSKIPEYNIISSPFFKDPEVKIIINSNYVEIKTFNNLDCIMENISKPKKKMSYVCAIRTLDNKYIFLKRRTSFAYDKLINCYKNGTTEELMDHCIKCVYYMGSYDRARLRNKLTIQFVNIDPKNKRTITKRMLFLYFWRKFILDLLDLFDKHAYYENIILKILPGGKRLTSDMNLEHTISREVYEETGISNLKINNSVAFIRIFDNNFGEYYENLLFFSDLNVSQISSLGYSMNNETFGLEFIELDEYMSSNDHAIDLYTIYKITYYIRTCI